MSKNAFPNSTTGPNIILLRIFDECRWSVTSKSTLKIHNNSLYRHSWLVYSNVRFNFFFTVWQATVVQDLLNMRATRSQPDTLQRSGLFWTSDQSDIPTSTWQHTTLPTDRHQCPRGIRTRKPSKTLSSDPHLRPTENGIVQVTICEQ